MPDFHIGTAAWSIHKDYRHLFSELGSHLQRYSEKLNAVEINSSFYRDHRADTYARWAETVPENFRFSVKLSKVFTHIQKLKKGEHDLEQNLLTMMHLKNKFGCLLVQLPPSLEFDARTAGAFFKRLRQFYDGPVAFEPRHISWQKSVSLLGKYGISPVFADPEICALPPDPSFLYFRLHGSPEIYRSDYSKTKINQFFKAALSSAGPQSHIWFVFDNTTFGHAAKNALELQKLILQPKLRYARNAEARLL